MEESVIESMATKYYDELLPSNNPGLVLTKFYCALFEKNFNDAIPLIGRLGKMSKVFGRNLVFYAILDVFGMETVELSNVERIIYWFCKKRFIEDVSGDINLVDLSSYLEDSKKKLEVTKLLKERDPFDDK